jgi:hypothetical protein
MRTIEITISPTGGTTIQTRGFAGSSCRDATKVLEQALGLVQSDQATAEMHQSAPAQEQLRQSNR